MSPDPYDYIKRTYGVSPVIGQRVRQDQRDGVIVRPRGNEHYVHVRFDGHKHTSLCHPTDIVILGRGDAR